MQSQPSGDTETFGDQSHLSGDTKIIMDHPHPSWDMEVTQEKPKFPKDLEEHEAVTQEPTSLQPPVEATTKNQAVPTKTQEDTKTRTHEYVSTQEPTSSPLDVGVDKKAFQEEGVVTQEPTSSELIIEVHQQEEVVEPLVAEEVVSLPIQNNQDETLDNKVWTQSSQEIFNLDYDEEKDAGEENIQGLIEELSLLKIEVNKWKGEVDRYQEGMIPLVQHRNTIRELREIWAEELMFHKFRWEEIQKELKELKKLKSMQVEKDQLYTLSQ